MRTKFFKQIKGALIFDSHKFIRFINNKDFLPDSYTSFKNKIGLVDSKGDFISDKNDVVLNRPYKDCILAGGQDTEDAKRDELFYNEILGSDEIDRLLDLKVFTNFKKYDKDGEHDLKAWTLDKDGDIKDNLIIKGNNLLVLHSLKKKFAGKVKLIYIDPPYNTGSDSFRYNDKFNHSTWLTFMKNRLEVSKELLKKDGVIFVSCDDNELAHLKLLMDDIQELHFESIFHIKVRHENRILRQDNRYQKVMEHILCYGKYDFNPNRIAIEKDRNLDYQYEITLKPTAKPTTEKISNYMVEIYKVSDYEIIKKENGLLKEYNIRGSLITQKGSASEFYEKNLRERKGLDGYGALYKIIGMGEKGDGIGYRFVRQPFDKNGVNGFYYQGKPLNQSTDKKNPFPNYYDFEKEFNNSADEGDITFKNGKKPEKFLAKVFEISDIEENDIVMDYHVGSGSTASVAHKMKLQYIGVEQLDSQIDLTTKRLQNVVNGDQTGISKDVNWQKEGGGGFVYMELLKENQNYIDKINHTDKTGDLIKLYNEIKETAFINYKVDVSKINDTIKEFENLSLDEMKRFLIETIDQNSLYVNYSEINDKTNGVNETDKKINSDFYNLEK